MSPPDADTWSWLEELTGDSGPRGATPASITYVRKLGLSTKSEIERIDKDIADHRRESALAHQAVIDTQEQVMEAVTSMPEKVAKLAFDQAHQEREDRRQAREAKMKLLTFVWGRFFDAVNLLFSTWWFNALVGVALVLFAAGVFARNTGITLSAKDGFTLTPLGAVSEPMESLQPVTPSHPPSSPMPEPD